MVHMYTSTRHRAPWKLGCVLAAVVSLVGIATVAVLGLPGLGLREPVERHGVGNAKEELLGLNKDDSEELSPNMFPDGDPDCKCPKGSSVNLFRAPPLTINIDKHGKADYKEAVATIHKGKKEKIAAVLRGFKKMPKFKPLYDKVCGMKDKMLSAMNNDLLKAGEEVPELATALDVDVCDVLFISVMYDVAGGCTSAVANTADGKIVHGRNLDYSAFPTIVKTSSPFEDDKIAEGTGKVDAATIEDLTFLMTFKLHNGDEFSGPNYLGFVGMLTGVRADKLSISLNQRYPNGQGASTPNFEVAFPNGEEYNPEYISPSLWIRSHLQAGTSYEDALKHMDNQKFIVPAYITMGGVSKNQGSISMVNRNTKHHRGHLGTHNFPCRGDFCLITNEDPFEMRHSKSAWDQVIMQKPEGNDREYNRYWCGVKHMDERIKHRHMNADIIFDVFTSCLTFVPWRGDTFATTFATSMSAAEKSPLHKVAGQEYIK